MTGTKEAVDMENKTRAFFFFFKIHWKESEACANSYKPTWWQVYERYMGRGQTSVAVREEDKERGWEGAEARKDSAHVDCK